MDAQVRLQKVENDIREHYSQINETKSLKPVKKRGVFLYFLPFLLGSFLVWYLVTALNLYLNISNIKNNFGSTAGTSSFFRVFLPVICFALVHIIGGIVARKLSAKKNEEADRVANERFELTKKLYGEIAELKVVEARLKSELPRQSLLDIEDTRIELNEGNAEDPVKLADFLADKYDSMRRIENDIGICESAIAKNQTFVEPARYSSFRFFVPFFIASIIEYILVSVFLTIQSFLMVSNGDPSGKLLNRTAIFIPLVFFMVIHVIGGIYARKKRDKLNAVIDDDIIYRARCCEDNQNKSMNLKARLTILQEDLSVYNDRVPIGLRKRTGMQKVKKLLESGKAKTFDEAVAMCMHNKPVTQE